MRFSNAALVASFLCAPSVSAFAPPQSGPKKVSSLPTRNQGRVVAVDDAAPVQDAVNKGISSRKGGLAAGVLGASGRPYHEVTIEQ